MAWDRLVGLGPVEDFLLTLQVFRIVLLVVRVKAEVELRGLGRSRGLRAKRAVFDRVVGLTAVKAEVLLAAALLFLFGEWASGCRLSVKCVNVHRCRSRAYWSVRDEGLDGVVEPVVWVEGAATAAVRALVFAFLESLEQAVVDPNGQVLEGFEGVRPIEVCEVVLYVGFQTMVELRPQGLVVPLEEGGEGEEPGVVLDGGSGLLEGSKAPFCLLGFVQNTKSGVDVLGKQGEGVEPGGALKVAGLVQVWFYELESGSAEVSYGVKDL